MHYNKDKNGEDQPSAPRPPETVPEPKPIEPTMKITGKIK